MDSRLETYAHILQVQHFLNKMIIELTRRAEVHDKSKLETPEKEFFDKYTHLLKDSTYGSEEYFKILQELKPALDHHYKNNSHHPEHYENGIKGMNILDILEMLCDWKAAGMRHANGNIVESIEKNSKRFNYSDDLKQIFLNSVDLL